VKRPGAALAAAGGAAVAVQFVPGLVFWRGARNRLLPGLAGAGRPDHVALTFDDGPDPASTPAVLDALDRLGWRATFFCLGSAARSAPGLVAEMAARGHEIGVHGWDHRSHLRRPPGAVVADVAAARDLLEELAGRRLGWFRPPYGAVSLGSVLAARRTGLRLVLWTTWGRDWEPGATSDSVARTVAGTFRPGATVLLHDSDATSAPDSWRATAEALPLLAARWHHERLRVGPLGEHF
jgi:peptidoglycan/xylan/chitin deacetylase (PgdA/CDA1 family)